jgi:hypothetical protein
MQLTIDRSLRRLASGSTASADRQPDTDAHVSAGVTLMQVVCLHAIAGVTCVRDCMLRESLSCRRSI